MSFLGPHLPVESGGWREDRCVPSVPGEPKDEGPKPAAGAQGFGRSGLAAVPVTRGDGVRASPTGPPRDLIAPRRRFAWGIEDAEMDC